MVLLKGVDDRGFVFYTDYRSHKGVELERNPRAALVFYWAELERQVRVEGTVSRVSPDESAAYFATRPLASRLSAWTSHQSAVIADRDVLDARAAALARQYSDDSPPPPPSYWGGYRVRHAPSSSGRVVPTACTTVCSTRARAASTGASSGCRPSAVRRPPPNRGPRVWPSLPATPSSTFRSTC